MSLCCHTTQLTDRNVIEYTTVWAMIHVQAAVMVGLAM